MKIKEFIKNYSLLPQGVRYKLLIAFCLMSIIPLLVIGYLVNNFIMLEVTLTLGQVSLVVLFCVVIAWLGLYLAKGIVERVVDMALEAKTIMEGNYEQRIAVQTGDEIGQIGDAINFPRRLVLFDTGDKNFKCSWPLSHNYIIYLFAFQSLFRCKRRVPPSANNFDFRVYLFNQVYRFQHSFDLVTT